MTDRELIAALRRIGPETGSPCCLGCGYEHGCSIHGCAVIRAAADRLAGLNTPPADEPLTLEDLWKMDGEPVWVVQPHKVLPPFWGIVDIEDELVANFECHANFEDYDTEWLAYRCKIGGNNEATD